MSSIEPADIPTGAKTADIPTVDIPTGAEAGRETAGSLGLCGPVGADDRPAATAHPGPARVLHPSVAERTRWFSADQLPPDAPSAAYAASAVFTEAMHRLVELALVGPQFALGLQALVQARDCCVRAAISATEE